MIRPLSFAAAIILALFINTASISVAQDSDGEGGAELTPAPEDELGDILVVNMARILTEASAYTAIQGETERVRGLIDEAYQQRLNALQAEGETLRGQELDMDQDEFDQRRRSLEARAEQLQFKRQENIGKLEAGRTQAIALVDQRLNAVFAQLIEETGASYIFNMQVLVLWPEANDVTSRAVVMLNEVLPTVSFNATFDSLDEDVLDENVGQTE